MTKYCMRCGQANVDEAAFCTACGQGFPALAQPVPPTPAPPPPPQAGVGYTTELVPGAHKHMLTDTCLRDATGRVLLVARKQSLLHAEYTIVDGNETVTGFMKPQSHLTHHTSIVEDAGHDLLGSVQVSNVSQDRRPPSCWVEDAGGQRVGSVLLTGGLGAIVMARADGAPIFEASILEGSGVRQALSELERRAYSINLLDPGFPLPMLLGVIVALS